MTDAEREQMIRTSEPSENERFLLDLLDKARGKIVEVWEEGWEAAGDVTWYADVFLGPAEEANPYRKMGQES